MLHFPRQELLESTNPKGGRERSTTAAQQREKCRRKSKNSPPRHFGASKEPGQSLAAAARASNTAWHLGELLCSSAWRTDGSELRDPERTGCTARSISSISQRSAWCHAVLSQREKTLTKSSMLPAKGSNPSTRIFRSRIFNMAEISVIHVSFLQYYLTNAVSWSPRIEILHRKCFKENSPLAAWLAPSLLNKPSNFTVFYVKMPAILEEFPKILQVVFILFRQFLMTVSHSILHHRHKGNK